MNRYTSNRLDATYTHAVRRHLPKGKQVDRPVLLYCLGASGTVPPGFLTQREHSRLVPTISSFDLEALGQRFGEILLYGLGVGHAREGRQADQRQVPGLSGTCMLGPLRTGLAED